MGAWVGNPVWGLDIQGVLLLKCPWTFRGSCYPIDWIGPSSLVHQAFISLIHARSWVGTT